MAESSNSHKGGERSRLVPVPVDHLPLTSKDTVPASAELIPCFLNYDEYFQQAEQQPEVDIRPRFLAERNRVAKFIEYIVRSRWREIQKLEQDWRRAENSPEVRLDVETRYGVAMIGISKILHWYSQINDDDTKATQARSVSRFFMDNTFRHYLRSHEMAPNAEKCEIFGEYGESAPYSYFAMDGPEDNPLRNFILKKMLIPLDQTINKLRERAQGHPRDDVEQQDEWRTVHDAGLEMCAKIFECLIVTSIFAGSVILIYNFHSTRTKLIVAPFMSFICAVPGLFLSKRAQGLLMLMAGIWAVLAVVVFLQVGGLASTTK